MYLFTLIYLNNKYILKMIYNRESRIQFSHHMNNVLFNSFVIIISKLNMRYAICI